jgi:hypothetical protein
MLLQKIQSRNHLTPALNWACAIDVGVPHPDETRICMKADAVLFEQSDTQNTITTQQQRPEQGYY